MGRVLTLIIESVAAAAAVVFGCDRSHEEGDEGLTSVPAILSNLPDEIRLQRLEALVAASETLNRASGLDDILQAILELVKAQLDCERATAFLRDARTG